MAIRILHTGQTGVERGVDRAARANGFVVAGFSTPSRRDEFTLIPPHIAADLEPCAEKGPKIALHATVAVADMIVVIVPDLMGAENVRGLEATRRSARRKGVTMWVVDVASDFDKVIAQIRTEEAKRRELSLLVTGPRRTRWPEGEHYGWRFVGLLALAASVQPQNLD